MNEVGYIYPQWAEAKRRLTQALEAPNVTRHEVKAIVDLWFRNYCFEFGVEITRDRYYSENSAIDIDRMNEHKAASILADSILQKKMFMKETRNVLPNVIATSYRIAVFGVPEIVGPAERQINKP